MSSTIFFFNDTATTEIYTLSLHDALPIYVRDVGGDRRVGEEHGLQVVGGDAGADGHRKFVDGFVGIRLEQVGAEDRKSTRLNSSHSQSSDAGFCLKKKK